MNQNISNTNTAITTGPENPRDEDYDFDAFANRIGVNPNEEPSVSLPTNIQEALRFRNYRGIGQDVISAYQRSRELTAALSSLDLEAVQHTDEVVANQATETVEHADRNAELQAHTSNMSTSRLVYYGVVPIIVAITVGGVAGYCLGRSSSPAAPNATPGENWTKIVEIFGKYSLYFTKK